MDYVHRDRDKNMPDWNAGYGKYYGGYDEETALLNQTHRKDMKVDRSFEIGHVLKSTPPTLSSNIGVHRTYSNERSANNATTKQVTIDKHGTTEHMKINTENAVGGNSAIAAESLDPIISNWTSNAISTDLFSDVDTNEISDNGQQIAQNSSEYQTEKTFDEMVRKAFI